MAMGKLINGVKHLVNSISVKNPKLTKSICSTPSPSPSPCGILLKRLITEEDSGNQENILSFLKYPIPIHNTNTNADIDVVVENIDLPCSKDSLYLDIRGHSHGIVCLINSHKSIILCNPATREFRVLPPSILMTTRNSHSESVGFGYDPESKDFKVVRVVVFYGKYDAHYKAEVLNMSKGGWREIITPVPTPAFVTPSFEMFHNGIYYWWSCSEDANKTIRTFDISNEVFGTLPVPGSCVKAYDDIGNDHDWISLSLMVWKGSIVLFNYSPKAYEKSFDIWAMYDESDGEVSWSKMLTIGPLSGVVRPLLFVNSDELIMEAKEGKVISYNLITKEVKNLPVNGNPDCFTGFLFQKSLLSVGRTA